MLCCLLITRHLFLDSNIYLACKVNQLMTLSYMFITGFCSYSLPMKLRNINAIFKLYGKISMGVFIEKKESGGASLCKI